VTKRERAQVVELLRCAADACNVDSSHGLYSAWLATLAHNLATAGGLCAAFHAGAEHAREIYRNGAKYSWRPGCQRSAP
jgi:hypothetical protein